MRQTHYIGWCTCERHAKLLNKLCCVSKKTNAELPRIQNRKIFLVYLFLQENVSCVFCFVFVFSLSCEHENNHCHQTKEQHEHVKLSRGYHLAESQRIFFLKFKRQTPRHLQRKKHIKNLL